MAVDLEQFFGSWRWHERRATGRKCAARTVVVQGAASLACSLATRLQPFSAQDLAGVDRAQWRRCRAEIESRRQTQRRRKAFRRNTKKYLDDLTARTIKLVLLSWFFLPAPLKPGRNPFEFSRPINYGFYLIRRSCMWPDGA